MAKKLYIDKLIIAIVILNLAEICIIAAILILTGFSRTEMKLLTHPGVLVIVFSALAAIIINTLAALGNRTRILRTDSDNMLIKDALSKLESLNITLRAQRHDFMNHLQVVYSLMEMEEYADAHEYIEKVYNDIQKVSRVMKTSNPAVNALLQAKLLSCEKKGIRVSLDVTTQLKDLAIPAWEYCRVLGNLIDNAVYALEERNADMQLVIQLFEDLKGFGFRISDNGSPIPGNLIDKIFMPGFTTKGEKGEGMGLAISSSLLEEYGGWLKVQSSSELTVFEGSIPKQVN